MPPSPEVNRVKSSLTERYILEKEVNYDQESLEEIIDHRTSEHSIINPLTDPNHYHQPHKIGLI